jgi:hypothetical protein
MPLAILLLLKKILEILNFLYILQALKADSILK